MTKAWVTRPLCFFGAKCGCTSDLDGKACRGTLEVVKTPIHPRYSLGTISLSASYTIRKFLGLPRRESQSLVADSTKKIFD